MKFGDHLLEFNDWVGITRKSCDSKNANMLIIRDYNIDSVFRQFTDGRSNSVTYEKSVRIRARAQLFNKSRWHWVDGNSLRAADVVVI